MNCSLGSNPLGSCLAFAGNRCAHAVVACQFRHASFARVPSLAAMLHNAPLCAVRLARPLYLYTKPVAYGRASRPVRAARRTTHTMQNGRRQRPCASSVRGSRPRSCQLSLRFACAPSLACPKVASTRTHARIHARGKPSGRLRKKAPQEKNRLLQSAPMLAALAKPHRIKQSHRRRRRIASGVRDYNYFRDYEPGTGRYVERDRKSTRLNSSHSEISRMPSSA